MVYDERITGLCERIADLVKPVRIIIFNEKHTPSGELVSFKLCVIVKENECTKIEQKIYLSLECEVPFDVLVYNDQLWNSAVRDPDTFAYRGIKNGGVILYESE